MDRNSWLIIGVTFVICAAFSFFYIRPAVFSALDTYRETAKAQKELSDISKKKEILSKITQNDQLKNLYQTAASYIPEDANSSGLVLELTAMAAQNNLQVQQISTETNKTAATSSTEETKNQTTTTTATPSAAQAPEESQLVDFSFKVSGSFSDFLNFLKSVETSSRLMIIPKMSLVQGDQSFTAEMTVEVYWKKGVSLEKTLANINVSNDTIQKFQNLKTYGTPINLTTEAGFGRQNPFESAK